MFIPEPNLYVNPLKILKSEPMARGGNPHTAEYLYREGGTTVYIAQGVSPRTPESQLRVLRNGLTEKEKERFVRDHKEAKKYHWNVQRRNPRAYVKGRITHKDHKTVNLGDVWHRVAINTEDRARGAFSVAFVD